MPTDQVLVAARPEVRVDGRLIAALTDGLDVMRVHEGRDTPATLELEVGNWGTPPAGGTPDFRFLDRSQLDFGKRIEVAGGGRTIFQGRITGLEAVFAEAQSPRLVVLAEDELQLLRLTRRTRTWVDKTDADIIDEVARDHSLSSDVDLGQPPQAACIAQLDQSDLAFLRERVRRVGGELWVHDGTLHAARRGSGGDGARPPRLRVNQEIRELRVRADLAHQATEVVVGGWNVDDATAIEGRAGDDALGGESSGGDTGATLLERAFGTLVQTVAAATPATQPEADELAKALFRARARRFVRGEATCIMSADVGVGRAITIEGAGAPFSGDYQVVDIVHRYDTRAGARSEIVFERAILKGSDG